MSLRELLATVLQSAGVLCARQRLDLPLSHVAGVRTAWRLLDMRRRVHRDWMRLQELGHRAAACLMTTGPTAFVLTTLSCGCASWSGQVWRRLRIGAELSSVGTETAHAAFGRQACVCGYPPGLCSGSC